MITWATIIPLIGGMALGNREAFESEAEWAVSFPGFEENNKSFREYFTEVDFFTEVPGEPLQLPKVDVISTVCPCAGLSMLNASTRGANCAKNDWMYLTAETILRDIEPKVLVGENAPGLFTRSGEAVRSKLMEIAFEYGYSLSFVKTNTMLHGVPQRRVRTFYFLWKFPTAPILNWYDRPRETVSKYLNYIPESAANQDEINPNLIINPTFMFLQEKEGDNWRKELVEHRDVWRYIEANNLFDEFIAFSEGMGLDKWVKKAFHIMKKRADGKGYWNNSTVAYSDDHVNAIIGKNITETLHPTEVRSFTYRELLWFMGHPHDFDLHSSMYTIFQNVPVCTARDWSLEIKAVLNGQREFSDSPYIMQDNTKQTIS